MRTSFRSKERDLSQRVIFECHCTMGDFCPDEFEWQKDEDD